MALRAITTVNRFWANLPLRAKALALVWIPLPILLVAGVTMFRAERAERQTRTSVERTWDIRGDLQDVMILLLDADASVREFVVRGDAAVLAPYLRCREMLPAVSAHLGT